MIRESSNHNRHDLGHRVKLDRMICCHPICEAPALEDIASTVPLCERHIFQAYRATNQFLAAKTAADQQYELLPSEAEYLPGPCPSCGTVGLLVELATGFVECRAASCGYGCARADFGPRRKTLMAAAASDREVVYYMRLGNRVKIGTSRNLRRRLGNLNPEDCLTFELGGRPLELVRHKQFAHLRTVGEWFHLGPELTRHVNTIDVLA